MELERIQNMVRRFILQVPTSTSRALLNQVKFYAK